MRRLLTIKGVIVMVALVVLLAIGATYVVAQGIFNKNVTATWSVQISGDAIQVYEADGTTVVSAIDFGTSFRDFFGNVPILTHKVVVKNLSATIVQVVVTGDGGDGIIPLFGPVTGDLKSDPDNAFVLQPQGQPGDMTMGYVGLTLMQFTPGSKTTTIIFRATEPGTQQVVVPNAQTGVEGNSLNNFPFNIAPFGASSMRYQQVYSSGDIGGLGIIDKIAYRPEYTSTGQVFSGSGDSVEIRLSHTPKTVDGLSTTFANNVGADETQIPHLDKRKTSLAPATKRAKMFLDQEKRSATRCSYYEARLTGIPVRAGEGLDGYDGAVWPDDVRGVDASSGFEVIGRAPRETAGERSGLDGQPDDHLADAAELGRRRVGVRP